MEAHSRRTRLPHHLLCIFEEFLCGVAAVVVQETVFPSDVISRQVMKQVTETFALLLHIRTKCKLIVFIQTSERQ